MKKLAFTLLAAVLLCGCAAGRPAAFGAGEGEGQAAPSPAAAVPAAQPPLHPVTPGDQTGLYTTARLDPSGQGHSLLLWIDYAAGQQAVVCPSPNCTHSDAACPAWGVRYCSLVGEQIVETVVTQDEAGAERFRLLLCARDGSNPQLLAQSADGLFPLAWDEQAVYYYSYGVDEDGQGSCILYRAARTGGEPVPVQDMGEPRFLGCAGRRLVLERIGSGSDESDDAAPLDVEVYLLDIDTGEETPLAAWEQQPKASGAIPYWDDAGERLYWVDAGAVDALQWVDADGAQGQVALQWPFEVTAQQLLNVKVAATVGEAVLVDLTYRDDTGTRRVSVDPATGQAAELTLRYSENLNMVPLKLLGQSADSLFVQFASQEGMQNEINPEGGASQSVQIQGRYGLIPFADYLANEPNYREIAVELAGTVHPGG